MLQRNLEISGNFLERKMELNIKKPSRSRFKHPVVKLERCDKIWKTLQLIRSLQDKHLEDLQDWIKREPITSEKTLRKEPPMTFIPDKTLPLNLIGEPNLCKPYIKYQPIFNNGNGSLPQFELAEKSRVNLYHCEICSQEYWDYRRFTDHQEKVHGIFTIQEKLVVKKEKVQNKINTDSHDNRSLLHDISQQQIHKKLIPDENVEIQDTVVRNTSPQNDSIRCKLCGKCCKNIKRHMVDYHKIKCIGVLSKVTDKNSNLNINQSYSEFESLNHTPSEIVEQAIDETKEITSQDVGLSAIENITSVSKRKLNMPTVGVRKRLRSVSSMEEESIMGNKKKIFKCENCDRGYTLRGSLSRHKRRHKECVGTKKSSKAKRNEMKLESSVKLVKNSDNDNNNIVKKIQRSRLSSAKEHSRSDRLENTNTNANGNVISAEKGGEKSREIKCVCGRTFRTTSILANHKSGCKLLKDTDAPKSSETRTGSDRDSGISITIKKKNNSYEIVSKDGNDEQPSRNGYNVEEPEICEESSDSSSENSESSEFDDQLESLVPEKSKYSESHRILKLEIAEEDVDVDIGDYVSNEDFEGDRNGVFPMNEHRVPLLRNLCKKLLIHQGIIPKEEKTHQCRSCKIFLGSYKRLAKHVEKHKKLMKRSCSCRIKFNGVEAFDDHIAVVHPKCIVCPYCKEKYKSIAALGEHLCIVAEGAQYTEIINEDHSCPICNIHFDSTNLLDRHMRSKHLDPHLPFQCYKCLEKFPNEVARSLHLNQKHDRGSACSVCNHKFQSVRSGQKHEAYHRGVGFPCHICKKTYRSKSYHSNHIKTVHSDFSNDKLECFICHRSIKTKSFRKHVLRHSSNLKCEICHKIVYGIKNLEKHIMYCHSNENYPRRRCNACGASFPTNEQLEAHVMVEKSIKNKQSKKI